MPSRCLRSSAEPFLQFAQRRDLREKVFRAFVSRGDNGGATDNKAIIAETVQAARRAGAASRLCRLRPLPARRRHGEDAGSRARPPRQPCGRRRAQARSPTATPCRSWCRRKAATSSSAPWDWRYYAEKLRQRRCDFDEAAIKPYLDLDRMIEAAFYTAQRLFGLSFTARADVPVWHPDVRVWEVRDARRPQGRACSSAIISPAPSKRSGAWMTSLRDQEKLDGDIQPLIVNVCNFSKAPDGEPTLLELRGCAHAVPRVRPRAARPPLLRHLSENFRHQRRHRFRRTAVAALRALARAARRAAALRAALPDRRADAGGTAAAADRRAQFQPRLCHGRVRRVGLRRSRFPFACRARRRSTPSAFENQRARRASACRTRSSCGTARRISGMSSPAAAMPPAYYSYMWSEVLDADAFAAFEETGDIFDPATAKRLHDTIYAAGGSRDPADAYKAFRGRLPTRRRAVAQARLCRSRSAAAEHAMDLHTAGHRRGVVARRISAPSRPAARSSPRAATRSRRCWRWRRRSPPSIRT